MNINTCAEKRERLNLSFLLEVIAKIKNLALAVESVKYEKKRSKHRKKLVKLKRLLYNQAVNNFRV